ncbi:hypothetical protein NONI108955_02180 [Nocardia ninae]|uniref:DUF4351 domain-containing protein n=1 Tax=Nocardia ninae NBRC 108245 TaxID=1210091 RepID=A0A511ML35_9NOCA|nr:hypothetical protein [Nocardia ninae]GEM41345.1 hypothetical protein NN4_58640 [Nocardia ninae NBRC 108245]
MPGHLHELLIELFRQRPQLAAELLTSRLGTDLPEFDHARLECGDFPDINPTEYRADAVVVLANGTTPAVAVVVEVQLQPDKDKTWSWPVYLTTLRARLKCPTILLVLCPYRRTAAYCRRPITVAPEFTLKPLVLSPTDVPVVTDPETAEANPELAVLSAVAHGNHPDSETILTILATRVLAAPHGKMYIDQVTGLLPEAARHFLESLMTAGYEYQNELIRTYYFEGKTEGNVEGEAKALLRVLRKRGFHISDTLAARVAGHTDIEQLDVWLDRAVDAASLDEVFGE